MYLKQITLEGFKSYAKRVTLENFDPHFNAITGLNGTGKSNILDAICFVLGLSKMAKVRVQNLQGLIFKEGQAGVSRASVSLLFDNSNPSASPPGFESYKEISIARQVAIGGKTKYLINGCNAQPNRVQNLFQSIHLNINNPHFMIMQGRVAQVLNMSPKSILEMIEEVVGTRMYEFKKSNAQKTISKKESKLLEINNILEKEIQPKLKRLQKEQEIFTDWQTKQTKLKLTKKALESQNFINLHKKKTDTNLEIQNVQDSISQLENLITENKKALHNLQNAKHSKNKSEIDNVEAELTEIKRELKALEDSSIKAQTQIENQNDSLTDLNKNIKKLKNKVEKENSQITKLANDYQTKKLELDKLKGEKETLEAKHSIINSNSSKIAIKEKLEKEIKELTQEKLNVEPHLKSLEKEFNKKKKENENEIKNILPLKEELKQLESTKTERKDFITNYKEKEKECQSLKNKKIKNENEILKVEENLKGLLGVFPYLEFVKEKEKGLKGIIAELVTVKNESEQTAIETAGGAKLRHLVVSDHLVGKRIIEKNQLLRRTTIIPVDKIKSKGISKGELLNVTKKLNAKNVKLAVECLEFDEYYLGAVNHVFGRSIVCGCNENAKKIAFSKDLLEHKVVTLDGDTYSPSGIISGGFVSNNNKILDKIREINTLKSITNLKKKEYRGICDLIENSERQLREMSKEFERMNEEEIRYNGLKARFKMGMDVGQEDNLKKLETNLGNYREMFEELTSKLVILNNKKEEITKFNKTSSSESQEKISELLKISKSKYLSSEKLVTKLQIQLESLKQSVSSSESDLLSKKITYNELQSQTESLTDTHQSLLSSISSTKVKLAELVKNKESLQSSLQSSLIKKESLSNSITNSSSKISSLTKNLKDLTSSLTLTNQQISTSKLTLQSSQDFLSEFFTNSNQSPDSNLQKSIQTLEADLESLSTKVNKKVFIIQEKTTKEFKELITKRDKVLKDKKKIVNVLLELDKRKDKSLKDAWLQVNRNFGSIFSTLLPGNNCELRVVEGKKLKDGLSIKVKLGNTWKESLSELSGGQRSLLALSLILSLLLFKPAPIYILDEIDAALDLTHTQNIGIMLKKHFGRSQFLIVSLKEGLFQNANVVFRTKFEEGVSSVVRNSNLKK